MSRYENGRAIRKALRQVPVSQREVARRTGMSHTTVNRIASGGDATLGQVQDVLGALDQIYGEISGARQDLQATITEATRE